MDFVFKVSVLKISQYVIWIIPVFIQQRVKKAADCRVNMEMEVSAPARSHCVNTEAALGANTMWNRLPHFNDCLSLTGSYSSFLIWASICAPHSYFYYLRIVLCWTVFKWFWLSLQDVFALLDLKLSRYKLKCVKNAGLRFGVVCHAYRAPPNFPAPIELSESLVMLYFTGL